MSFKFTFIFCIQFFCIQTALSQCISNGVSANPAYDIPYDIPYGLGSTYGLPIQFSNEPYGFSAPLDEATGYAAAPFFIEPSGYATDLIWKEPVGFGASYLNEPSYTVPLFNNAVLLNEPCSYNVPILNEPYGYGTPVLNELNSYDDRFGYGTPFLNGFERYDDPNLNEPSGYGISPFSEPKSYDTRFLTEPYGYGAVFLNEPNGLYASRWGSVLEYSPTIGGCLSVSSSSAIPPVGLSVVSDNVFEDPLAVIGEIPLIGTAVMDDTLPSLGSGVECGNGLDAMVSDIPTFAPGYGAAYDPTGNFGSSYANTGIGYEAGWVDRGCGCGFY